MRKPEILSPAGNFECLKAAVLAGADAVYLGGSLFGARAFASNFNNDELKDAVEYAHLYDVKVYITVNTLIYDSEVKSFMKYVDYLVKINVDALLMQDIGMIDLVRQTYPDLEIHASTQLHIHNEEGVKFAKSLGIKRVVLARETSIDLVKKIKNELDMDIEIFVQGALCISYSGQCLMSSLIGGRSGNRGTCAGSCRLKYDVLDEHKNKVNKEEYNLSTKDLCSLENIERLIKSGVDSLKIEGRMKSSSYVYLVTSIYRKAVDSYFKNDIVSIDNEDIFNLKKTFNRLFTKGFLFNSKNNEIINPYRPNHLGVAIGKVVNTKKNSFDIKLTSNLNINDGIRIINNNNETGFIVTKMTVNNKNVNNAISGDIVTLYSEKKVEANSDVVITLDYNLNKKITNMLKTSKKRIPVDIICKLNKNQESEIIINNSFVYKKELEIEKSINNPTSKENIIKQLSKTGNTPYEVNNIDIVMDNNIFVRVSDLNNFRREAFDIYMNEQHSKINKSQYFREVPNFNKEKLKSLYIENYNLIERIDISRFNIVYTDIENDNTTLRKERVLYNFEPYDKHLLVGELGSLNYYKDVDTDFSLNVVNSYSVAYLHSIGVKKITLSYELTHRQIERLINDYEQRYNKHPNLEVIVYSNIEAMISKFNILEYYNLKKNGYLRDKFNNLYPIVYKNNMMHIYDYKVTDRTNEEFYGIGINSIRYNILNKNDIKNLVNKKII